MARDDPPSSAQARPDGPGYRVLKFGGTSLAEPTRIEAVCDLVVDAAARGPAVVVVSAFGGVTDQLADAARRASDGLPFAHIVEDVRVRHGQLAEAVSARAERQAIGDGVESLVREVGDLLQGVSLVRECSPRTRDQILSFGERLSAPVVASALRGAGLAAEPCDARSLIRTDRSFGAAWVNEEESLERIHRHFATDRPLQVVTGFIAATSRGETTTLGRSGSDYTATILGAALHADEVEIWTDVDGVMSADPRLVPEAFSLAELSYEELMELSHWGARVMHPAAVRPARRAGIPVRIRNTLNPSFPGTRIVAHAPVNREHPVRGIASIRDVALVRLEGAGLQGVPGIAQRLFGALAQERISVILITQASSERSICFAIGPESLESARDVIAQEFALERDAGLVDEVSVDPHCSVVAAVGEGMREVPGIAGRVFGVLGHHRINVLAIAQGSSELNISLAVARDDEERALRAVHDAFFGDTGTAQLYLAGAGRVGSAFVSQLRAQSEVLVARGVHIRLVGASRSRSAALDRRGIDLEDWSAEVDRGDATLDDLLRSVLASAHPHRIFVDCTASATVAGHYETLLRDGVAVVAANKLAFAETAARFRELQTLGRTGMGIYFETTVGAGLPVLRTVTDLVETGDTIRRIEGLLSGTLGFVFHRFGQGVRFSEALKEAHARGFTEPDPRDDLGGMDVARKLVILGRVAGMTLEPEDVSVEPLVPDPTWMEGDIEAFWDRLPAVDEHFEALRVRARAAGEALCYLGRLEPGSASVGLTTVAEGHACYGLGGSDNLVAVTTDRYADTPLVVRGPGAGPDVTAAGVFADVLRALAEAP